ncbi:MAG TPA: PaaI family thioesterase [Chitinophagales bacterium]|nr:PaaI family thioesterase [Chitinophagales bacterium]
MERIRTYEWQDPTIGAKQALQLSGIEYLHAMKAGELPAPPLMHTLDFNAERFEKGDCAFSFQPQEFHYNPIGCVHGGVITTLLDSAMGCVLQSTLPQGTGYTTLELKVNFLKTITTKTGKLTATGKIIHAGSRTALVEAQLTDENNLVYAHGISTCMILKF